MAIFLTSFSIFLAQSTQYAAGQPTSGGGALSSAGQNPVTIFEGALRSRLDVLAQPDDLIQALTAIHPVWASIFVTLGVISLFNGWRWRRWVTLILAGLLGVGLGEALGTKIGQPAIVGAAFALLFAVAALPMMRFTVALFAALAGAFAGANCWSAAGGDPAMHQYGAIMGFLVMGLLAFVAYQFVTISFTSIGGATMLVVGALSLMLNVNSWNGAIETALRANPSIIPLLAGVMAITGMILQHVGHKGGMKAVAAAAERGASKPAITSNAVSPAKGQPRIA